MVWKHLCLSVMLLLGCAAGARAADLVKMVADLSDPVPINLQGSGQIAPEGPNGANVLRTDGGFSGRIDLKALGIEPRQYDMMKIDVKTPRGANLRLSLENFPRDGELSHWYVLDGSRGPEDWHTIWVDLRLVEEIKAAGAYKGMASTDPTLRGLLFTGDVWDSGRAIQESESTFWLRNLRFVKRAVDIDWDMAAFTYTWNKGEDLVYTYPVSVKNCLEQPVTARLWLVPFSDVKDAKAEFAEASVALKPGETKIVSAKVWLPAAVAAKAPMLHCENFEVRASAEDIPDSEATILRSSDPIHLNVTVPIPEEKRAFPPYPKIKELPEYVLNGYSSETARAMAAKITVETVKESDTVEKDGALNAGMASLAFLYAMTGDKQCLEKLRDVFKAYADRFQELLAEYRKDEYRLVSHGIGARNVLQFCFKFGGTQRPPYHYSLKGNAANGACFGHMHAFDAIAADLSVEERDYILQKLFLPVIIQTRGHYFGLGNQQSTSNAVLLYGALATRHWPIAGFAYASEHGLLGNIKWTFNDDGLCREGHYQEYTISPILHGTELLYARGIDLYDQRLYAIMHSKGAEAVGFGYHYNFLKFVDENRFAGKPFLKELLARQKQTDGCQLTASTFLRWKTLAVAMNWGTHMMRGSHDRCALAIRSVADESGTADKDAPKKGRKGPVQRLDCGGGSYNHSSFGQSIIIADEGLQLPEPGTVTGYDIEGPVQFVQAVSSAHYPGSNIIRTFALLDKHVLVIDRVVNEKPRVIDWYLKNACGALSLPLEAKAGPWTEKPDDNRNGTTYGAKVSAYQHAKTDALWSADNGRMTMLGEKGTEIFFIRGAPAEGAKKKETAPADLMVRRRDVQATDFVAFFSFETQSVERVPVQKAAGGEANAMGVKISLKNGAVFHALANYEPEGTEVALGALKTTERFASDYPEKPADGTGEGK